VSKGEEYLLYKAQFVNKINELNLAKVQDRKNQTKELWDSTQVEPTAAIFKPIHALDSMISLQTRNQNGS
jgi:hypothetical protein